MKTAPISVTLINSCGTDLDVVNAARVSFHKESSLMSTKDESLINYLAKHEHKSPFNHCFLSFRVKAPIFVARQLVKHRFMPFNEVSRRYVTEEPEFYFPERYRKAAENVKQGSSHEEINIKWKKNEGSYAGRRNPCTIKFARLKWRVEASGEKFDMNIEDVEWNEVCPILSIPLNYDVSRGGIFDDTPTFDRVYPEKGYVKGNVRVISDLANRMKSSATPEQLEKFARAILFEWRGEVGRGQSPEEVCRHSLEEYNRLVDMGVCAEQARLILPLNTMTEWIWSGTLGAFCDMLRLRLKVDTQEETRQVATLIAKDVARLFPVSYNALVGEAK
jgi:thymidylate synthase ThyX